MANKKEPEVFFGELAPKVQPICGKYNIPPSLCLAQAALESGWGQYAIGEYNLFGRKWNGTGEYIEESTIEVINGERISTVAKFQKYNSLEEAVEDYCILLSQDHKYPRRENYNNLESYVRAYAPVYATDPEYADKILATIRANNLTQYDQNLSKGIHSLGEPHAALDSPAEKEAERLCQRTQLDGKSMERMQAIQNVQPRPNIPGIEKLLINEDREYGIQAKAIIDREGHWLGQSADMEIAKKMAGMGYSEIHVRMALMNASTETADKTTEQAKQYVQEIYAQVMTPELQQSLSHKGHGLR